jgi:hypothetical protein
MSNEESIQCPCGTIIRDPKQYKIVFIRKEALEIDILCPNDLCYLKELGYVKFEVNDDNSIKLIKAEFNTPFVTWNSSRIGYEKTSEELKKHLRKIVLELIDWDKIKRHLREGASETKFEDISKVKGNN